MHGHLDILITLAAILVAGKLAGQAGQFFGLPTPVGNITIGLILGPAVLGLIHEDLTLETLSQIGVILLMFLAGLETDMDTMKRVSVPAFAVASGGVVLPFVGGVAIGFGFGLESHETLFLGAILTATSVSISAQTLKELGMLNSPEGTTTLAAAIIDDIMGVVVLSFVFAMVGDGDPVTSIVTMAVFLPVSFGLAYVLTQPMARKAEEWLPAEAQLSLVIAAALAYAWAAEEIGGVATVTGAYMAGLIISRTRLIHSVSDGLNWVAYSFLVPVFFVGIGFKAEFSSLVEEPALVVSLLTVAVLGKIVGCYLPARLTGFDNAGALLVGVGMMSRGEVALVIAAAGLAAGAVGPGIFSASIVMTLATTIATPLALKLVHARTSHNQPSVGQVTSTASES